MELLDVDKTALQSLWQSPKERQRVQMILFQAIADTTDLSAKDVDNVMGALDNLLAAEKMSVPQKDQAL